MSRLAIAVLLMAGLPVTAAAQPLPGPTCADPTAFALSPLPSVARNSAWACLNGSWLDRWTVGRAEYDQAAITLKLGGLYGRRLPSRIASHFTVGGELRLFESFYHVTKVPPAIDEERHGEGIGEIRAFGAIQLFDSRL